jgi:hypothetical protein
MPPRGLDRLRDGSEKTGKIGNGELRRSIALFSANDERQIIAS